MWRSLPGAPLWRALLLVLLFAAVAAVCFLWLFPAIAPFMPFNDITVDE